MLTIPAPTQFVNPFMGMSLDAIVELNYQRQSFIPVKLPEPTLVELFTDVCQSLGLDPIMVIGKRRKRAWVCARQIYCYMAVSCTTQYSKEIAEIIKIDRSVVSYSYYGVKDLIEIDDPIFGPFWKQFIEKSRIYSIQFKQTTNAPNNS